MGFIVTLLLGVFILIGAGVQQVIGSACEGTDDTFHLQGEEDGGQLADGDIRLDRKDILL